MAIQTRMVGSMERYFTRASACPSPSGGRGASASCKSPGVTIPRGRERRIICRLALDMARPVSLCCRRFSILAIPRNKTEAAILFSKNFVVGGQAEVLCLLRCAEREFFCILVTEQLDALAFLA